MKDLIEVLGKIAAEADKVKHMVADAINSIPNEQFKDYMEDKVHGDTNGTLYYKGKAVGKVTDVKKTKNPLKSVQEYCKENRCWAAKDSNGLWHIYWSKPVSGLLGWRTQGHFDSIENKTKSYFPNVSWDKSLIAPDGRLILIEGKKQKKPKEAKFKVGKWYRSKRISSSIIHCQEVLEKNIIRIDGLEKNGTAIFCVDNLSDWYEIKHYNPNKKKKKGWKRGEPIFVWELNASYNIPAMVKYFHSFSTEGVFAFDSVIPNGRGLSYPRYRKYDPRLVGVPRKDWEEMPYA